jgi:3'-5' exoribonuclease
MKQVFLRDAEKHSAARVTTEFLVTSKQLKAKKTGGGNYLDLMLADRTAQMPAKMWDNADQAAEHFDVDDIVRVEGEFSKYNGRWQFTVRRVLKTLAETEVDFSDFLPKTAKNIDELWQALGEFVASINEPHLRTLLQSFMDDPAVAHAYRTAPAAKTLHHAFIGGLLDHVVSLFRTCDLVVRNYPMVNRDLLLTGAFLHDIGKIHELGYARSFSYTTAGQLLGHMIIELEMLHQKIAKIPGFPDDLKILIEHLIISHHGQYEFGSPKLPMFPEALMLHYLDDLDSKMESMRAHFEREAEMESAWTGYNSSLSRPLLNTQKFLRKKEATPQAAAHAATATDTK